MIPLTITVLVVLSLQAPSIHSQFDVPEACIPIIPSWALPQSAGGLLPPPPPPAGAVLARLAPGAVIIDQRLELEHFGAARLYPLVGPAREWRLAYRFEISGPNGRYVVYSDRHALVLYRLKDGE